MAARRRSRCARRWRRRPMRAPPPTTRRSPTGSRTNSARPRRPIAPSAASSPKRCATARTRTRARRSIARPSSASASRPRGRCRASSSPTTTSTTPTRPTSASPSSIPSARPACVIVKHANPCGVAEGASLVEAYRKALACDSDLGVRRHRGAQRHARCRSGARHHGDLHRGHHRAGRDRGSDRDRRREEEPAPAARRRPARSARRAA